MRFTVEVDKYNPVALIHCLKRFENAINDFEYDWRIYINAGGIDYGIYLNIDTEQKEIEISNGSTIHTDLDRDNYLDDVIDYICFNERGKDNEE